MAITPLQSRIEEILNGSTNITPRSRIEILLIELMDLIHSSTIEDLSDTEISDLENGEVLKYDAEQQKWVNGPASGSGGTSDYTDLSNKPQINGVTLAGNKTLGDIGAADASETYTEAEVDALLDEKADKSTTYTKAEVDASQGDQDARMDGMQANIDAIRVMMNATLYGYRVNKNNSDPETRVEYMYDSVGMTPARMNFTTGQFDYGSWADAWFVKENKPVALRFDGTVDYELDPNDYSKKADGTDSDLFVLLTEEPSDWAANYDNYFTKDENDDFVFVTGESAPTFAADTYYTNSGYAGNFMAQMPTVWFKRWEDADYEYVAICNKQLNSDFKAYAHDAGDGYINPFIYLPMFKGVIVDGKMRSISGVAPTVSTTGSTEKTAAEANGAGWQLWDLAKHELISDLLTLISRGTDSQGAFGQGDTNTYVSDASQNFGMLNTGQHKVEGVWKLYSSSQFYGESNYKHHVRVFHIEDFWGNRFDRCLGLNVVDMEYKYRMVRPYVLDADSTYVSTSLTAPESGWQKTQYVGEFGALPKAIGGSQSTYVCDHFACASSGNRLALFGGYCDGSAYYGSRYFNLNLAASASVWHMGGSPCFNNPHAV